MELIAGEHHKDSDHRIKKTVEINPGRGSLRWSTDRTIINIKIKIVCKQLSPQHCVYNYKEKQKQREVHNLFKSQFYGI